MGYAEKRGDYWRGRYKISPGQYGTVADTSGVTVRFRSRREAEQAANDAEAKARNGGRPTRAAGRITLGEYVNAWYDRQDLAASTMQNYRRTIEVTCCRLSRNMPSRPSPPPTSASGRSEKGRSDMPRRVFGCGGPRCI